MPKTLEKTRKQIQKKHGGTMGALHSKSRDSRRLHLAQVRDDRLEKIAGARKKNAQPLLGRVRFFQEFVQENGLKALDLETVQSKIHEFVHQYDEEYESKKATRRPGRPASTREDQLKVKIFALEKEYKDHGFFMPDLSTEANVQLLDRWDGRTWAYLTNLTWVTISSAGAVKGSSFPPQGH
ncbi:translation machinery-associated protein 16 [Diplogelasinospora grovesii]|uniref:Translation machinery-associated protein 16 n=1 Tax=Diplogelasinospora grovesii TaxID=303347 RepID=A0AAN6NA93_9PEZI|nr:translation machinery-associated protein 16 [Diplogelasinospora grovesii]